MRCISPGVLARRFEPPTSPNSVGRCASAIRKFAYGASFSHPGELWAMYRVSISSDPPNSPAFPGQRTADLLVFGERHSAPQGGSAPWAYGPVASRRRPNWRIDRCTRDRLTVVFANLAGRRIAM